MLRALQIAGALGLATGLLLVGSIAAASESDLVVVTTTLPPITLPPTTLAPVTTITTTLPPITLAPVTTITAVQDTANTTDALGGTSSDGSPQAPRPSALIESCSSSYLTAELAVCAAIVTGSDGGGGADVADRSNGRNSTGRFGSPIADQEESGEDDRQEQGDLRSTPENEPPEEPSPNLLQRLLERIDELIKELDTEVAGVHVLPATGLALTILGVVALGALLTGLGLLKNPDRIQRDD